MKQLSVIVLFIYSVVVYAENYRITKPHAWEVDGTKIAIKELYGYDKNMTQYDSRVVIIAPKLAKGRGHFIPIKIDTVIAAKSIAVLHNANERPLVMVFSIYDNTVLPYEFLIKMRQRADVTVVVEGKNGKLYSNNVEVDVSSCRGACGASPDEARSESKAALKVFMSEVEKDF